MNTNIESIVTEYAKANKINKAKLLAFAEQIVEIAGQSKKQSSGKRGRAVSVKVGDKFTVTSPLHMNKNHAMIDRANKAKINSGYQLDLSDIINLFEAVQ